MKNPPNVPLDCVGNPILVDPDLRRKEMSRIDSLLRGGGYVPPVRWAHWMTNASEEELDVREYMDKLKMRIVVAIQKLKRQIYDPEFSLQQHQLAEAKLEKVLQLKNDLVGMAKALGLSVTIPHSKP